MNATNRQLFIRTIGELTDWSGFFKMGALQYKSSGDWTVWCQRIDIDSKRNPMVIAPNGRAADLVLDYIQEAIGNGIILIDLRDMQHGWFKETSVAIQEAQEVDERERKSSGTLPDILPDATWANRKSKLRNRM